MEYNNNVLSVKKKHINWSENTNDGPILLWYRKIFDFAQSWTVTLIWKGEQVTLGRDGFKDSDKDINKRGILAALVVRFQGWTFG
jgi:hypothetical protein